MNLPRRLRPGDRVAVVTPSVHPDNKQLEAGLAVIRTFGLTVDFLGPKIEKTQMPPSLVARAGALRKAILDPSYTMILASTGGLGAGELLSSTPFDKLGAARKILMGFSDTTALLLGCLAADLACFCGPSASVRLDENGAKDDVQALEDTFALLSTDEPWGELPWSRNRFDVEVLASGGASGTAIGGNMTVLCEQVGTPWCPELDGAILFLEDVGVDGFTLRRNLGRLANAGVFDRIAGIVLGQFSYEPDLDGVDIADEGTPSCADVLAATFGGGNLPCVSGFNFSHNSLMATLPLGAECAMEEGAVSFGVATSD